MRHWMIIVGFGMVVGCGPEREARAVEEPPYRVEVSGQLRVRPDLAAKLGTAPVKSGASAAELEGFGRVSFAPGAAYALRVPFAGLVERVHVRAGEAVKAGTPLATIRSSELARVRAELKRTRTLAEAQRDALERAEGLLAQGAASAREVVDARAQLGSLEADVAGLVESLAAANAAGGTGDSFVLRASKAGSVLKRNVEPGERLAAGSEEPAFVIGDASRWVLTADFPERDATLLAAGARCTYRAPALGDAAQSGKVESVLPAIDRSSRTVRVICAPDADAPRLPIEMVARVGVEVSGDAGLTIPRSALLLRRDERVVLVRHERALLERRSVSTGLTLGGDVQILAGLSPGEDVISEGAVLLDGELDRLL